MKQHKTYNWPIIVMFILLTVCLSACSSGKNVEKAQLQYQVALDLLNKGDQARAIGPLMKANQLDPKNAEVQNLLGLVYSEKALYDKAEFHLKKAVALKDPYPEADNNLCTIYLKTERPDLAISACKEAVSEITYGTPERAYNNLGYAYEMKKDWGKAAENYKSALFHNKKFFLAHLNLGKIYFREKKFSASIKSFKAAEDGCTVCAEPPYRLGLSYLRLKKKKMARNSFQQCAKLDGKGEVGKQCRYYLKLIK